MTHRVKWHDAGREPKCPPNPRYPLGIDCDVSGGAAATCTVQIPYPAPRCGQYSIYCTTCKSFTLVTAAGRPDDPRSVKLACDVAAARKN